MAGWLLTYKEFQHHQASRATQLLRTIVACLFAIAVIYMVLADYFFPYPWLAYLGCLSIFLTGAITLLLIKFKKVKAACILLVASMWLSLVLLNTFAGGTQNLHMMNYFPLLLLTAMLLGGRAGVFTSLLTLLATFCIALAQQAGYLQQLSIIQTPIAGWLTLAINVSFTALLFYIGVKYMTDALKKAQQEIIERKQIENELRESEERFKVIADATPIPIIVTSYESGRIMYVNKTMARAFNKPVNEIYQLQSPDFYYHESDREKVLKEIKEKGRLHSTEVLIKSHTGQPMWVILSVRPLTFKGKRALLSGFYNINKIKATEAQNKALLAEMEEKNHELEMKNAELERFTYTVSHDLKSPIVTIKGFLGFLKLDIGTGNSQKIATDISNIEQATDTMQQLLEELLELSRIGRIVNPPEPVDLSQLANSVQQLLLGTLKKHNITVNIQPNMPTIMGDKTRLHEVFQNLIENAAKFMGKQANPQVTIGATHTGGLVTCYVKDNGIGIEKRYHETIFGLFDRLNKQIEGTGIGLALVKRIIEVHHGQIWVQSAGIEGQGSTFFFTLQLTPQQSLQPPAALHKAQLQ